MDNTTRSGPESLRIKILEALDIPLLPVEERFERITRTLERLFKTSAVYFSFVDDQSQWFKSIIGSDLLSLPLEHSLCQQTITSGDLVVCENISQNPQFADALFTLNNHKPVRFYAGIPLRSQGHIIGTLALVHDEPKSFSEDDLSAFKDIGGWAQAELSIPRAEPFFSTIKAHKKTPHHEQIDPNTRLWSMDSIRRILKRSFEDHLLHLTPISIMLVSIDRLSDIEAEHDTSTRIKVLQTLASGMRRCLRAEDAIGIFGDDTFLIILTDCSPQRSVSVANRISSLMSSLQFPNIQTHLHPIVRVGISRSDGSNFQSENQLIDLASSSLLGSQVFEVTIDIDDPQTI